MSDLAKCVANRESGPRRPPGQSVLARGRMGPETGDRYGRLGGSPVFTYVTSSGSGRSPDGGMLPDGGIRPNRLFPHLQPVVLTMWAADARKYVSI